MKISHIEIYKLPIAVEPFHIATGTMRTAQNLFVRIHTDEGITGVGECSAFPMIVGETLNTCFEVAKDFAHLIKGKDPLDIAGIMTSLDKYIYGNHTVKSAFDIALYDISSRYCQMPLYRFLKGHRKELITDVTIGIDTPEVMARKAVEFVARGFDILKIKLGEGLDSDVERIRVIRKAIGNDIRLRIDANQGWGVDEAIECLTRLAPYNIDFCEQPMLKWYDRMLKKVINRSPIPIMADESVFNFMDAERLIEEQDIRYINIKFAKSGGIYGGREISLVCAHWERTCMIGSMLESRLALTANAHFAMATKNVKYIDLDTALLGQQDDPVIGGMHYEGNKILVSDGIGLDCDIDQAYLDKQEKFIY